MQDPWAETVSDQLRDKGIDLLATGQVDALFRTASGGLLIKIQADLWDVKSRMPVWSGRVAVNWIRRYPLDDCLLRAALALAAEWDSGPPGE